MSVQLLEAIERADDVSNDPTHINVAAEPVSVQSDHVDFITLSEDVTDVDTTQTRSAAFSITANMSLPFKSIDQLTTMNDEQIESIVSAFSIFQFRFLIQIRWSIYSFFIWFLNFSNIILSGLHSWARC
jgi:hypothetical protein